MAYAQTRELSGGLPSFAFASSLFTFAAARRFRSASKPASSPHLLLACSTRCRRRNSRIGVHVGWRGFSRSNVGRHFRVAWGSRQVRAASVAFSKSRDGSRRRQALHVDIENAVRTRRRPNRRTWRSRRPCAVAFVVLMSRRTYASSSRRASPKLPPCSPRSLPFGPRPSPRKASTVSKQKAGPARIGNMERHKLQLRRRGIDRCADRLASLCVHVRARAAREELCGALCSFVESCVECLCHSRPVRDCRAGCYIYLGGFPDARCRFA